MPSPCRLRPKAARCTALHLIAFFKPHMSADRVTIFWQAKLKGSFFQPALAHDGCAGSPSVIGSMLALGIHANRKA